MQSRGRGRATLFFHSFRTTILVVLVALFVMAGLFIGGFDAGRIFVNNGIGRDSGRSVDFPAIFSVLIAAIILVVLLIAYLSGAFSDSQESRSISNAYSPIESIFKQLEELQKKHGAVSAEQRSELVTMLASRIKSEASEVLLEEIKSKISADTFDEKIEASSRSTLNRIYSEIEALGRRGTISLVLGVMTALGGIAALSYFVATDVTRQYQALTDFAVAFLPRLSIVLIIEVFAYFFLRLYKQSLAEIKYFQNEATNIEFNFVALHAAHHLKDHDLLRKVLDRFINIERNPILKRDETTRENQAEHSLPNELKLSPDHLVEILKVLSPNRTTDQRRTE